MPKINVEEVTAHLAGYNRLLRSWTRNRNSANCRAIGIANYEEWFKRHGVRLYQDHRTKEWKLDKIETPHENVEEKPVREHRGANARGGQAIGQHS